MAFSSVSKVQRINANMSSGNAGQCSQLSPVQSPGAFSPAPDFNSFLSKRIDLSGRYF